MQAKIRYCKKYLKVETPIKQRQSKLNHPDGFFKDALDPISLDEFHGVVHPEDEEVCDQAVVVDRVGKERADLKISKGLGDPR